jgi:hypothetical protein
VNSPGDDGAVAQSNTAAAGAAAGTQSAGSAPAATATQEAAATPAADATKASADSAPAKKETPKPADTVTSPGVSVSTDSVSAPGVSVAPTHVSTPAASAANDAVTTPAATADRSGASTPAASSDDATSAPDAWTWVWNWTGACVDAPKVSTRSGWSWVWNWSCSDDSAPGPAGTPGGGPSPTTGAPATVADVPAAPAADPPLLATPNPHQAVPRSARHAASGAAAEATPLVYGPRAGVPTASLFLPATPIGGIRSSAPRTHAAPPVARATPVRERDRRGGSGGGHHRIPFAPDPTSPLVATGASSGSPGFVLILLMALAAAVQLLDPAGLSQRVAAAVARGRDRSARRIDRPG